jgi:hypothetical protein
MWKSEGSQRAWGADPSNSKPSANKDSAQSSNVPDWLVGGSTAVSNSSKSSTSVAGAGLCSAATPPMSTGAGLNAVNQTQNVGREDVAGQTLGGLGTNDGVPRSNAAAA